MSPTFVSHTPFRLNVGAYFYLAKAAVTHMAPGSSIIGSSSVNSDMPSPALAPYAATKAAIANFSASLAQMLGEKGIRVNSVAPGPIWTPLIPSTMPPEKVASFGENTPLGRAGQPAELAPVYVLLASDGASYISACACRGDRRPTHPVSHWRRVRERAGFCVYHRHGPSSMPVTPENPLLPVTGCPRR